MEKIRVYGISVSRTKSHMCDSIISVWYYVITKVYKVSCLCDSITAMGEYFVNLNKKMLKKKLWNGLLEHMNLGLQVSKERTSARYFFLSLKLASNEVSRLCDLALTDMRLQFKTNLFLYQLLPLKILERGGFSLSSIFRLPSPIKFISRILSFQWNDLLLMKFTVQMNFS